MMRRNPKFTQLRKTTVPRRLSLFLGGLPSIASTRQFSRSASSSSRCCHQLLSTSSSWPHFRQQQRYYCTHSTTSTRSSSSPPSASAVDTALRAAIRYVFTMDVDSQQSASLFVDSSVASGGSGGVKVSLSTIATLLDESSMEALSERGGLLKVLQSETFQPWVSVERVPGGGGSLDSSGWVVRPNLNFISQQCERQQFLQQRRGGGDADGGEVNGTGTNKDITTLQHVIDLIVGEYFVKTTLDGCSVGVPISDVYKLLPRGVKTAIRTQHKTLTNFFKAHSPEHFVLLGGGSRVDTVACEKRHQTKEDHGEIPAGLFSTMKGRYDALLEMKDAAKSDGIAATMQRRNGGTIIGGPPPPPPASSSTQQTSTSGPPGSSPQFGSYYFDQEANEWVGEVALTEIPPAPIPQEMKGTAGAAGAEAEAAAAAAATTTDGGEGSATGIIDDGIDGSGSNAAAAAEEETPAGFKVQDYVHIIPTFFVPVAELVHQMPGYTEEHILQYFSGNKTVQIVKIANHDFIRIFGGYGRLDLAASEHAAEAFKQFEIDPTLAAPFEDAIANKMKKVGEFVDLRELLSAVPQSVVKQLPYAGPFSLLYFAQMQHKFAFAPENNGSVVLLPNTFSANLYPEHSPIPTLVSELFHLLVDGGRSIEYISDRLTPHTKREAERFFGTVPEALKAHKALFAFEPHTQLVHILKKLKQQGTSTLPLEEQLEQAVLDRDKKKIRRLRRKIHMMKNPDNPLLEPENLAKAIYEFLPQKKHISLKMLVKMLPFEIADVMPPKQLKFYKQFPGLFNLYEFREPTKWYLSRAELPLPPGSLRTDYTEDEVLRIVAEILTKSPTQEKPYSYVTLHIPKGARDMCKAHVSGGLQGLLARHPQYFSMVYEGARDDVSHCLVKLVAQPPAYEENGQQQKYGGESDDDDDFGVDS